MTKDYGRVPEAVTSDLRTAILKVRAGYQSQMRFCDIEALGYFREFVRRLDEALRDSDGSPKGGDARGSVEDDSAVPERQSPEGSQS